MAATTADSFTTVATTAEFDAVIAAQGAGLPVYAVFYAEVVPETGKSWCPDCVEAEPIINAALKDREAGAPVLWCTVKKSEYARNPDYAYRVHPNIKLTGVPTINKYMAGAVVATCANDDCKSDTKVRALFA